MLIGNEGLKKFDNKYPLIYKMKHTQSNEQYYLVNDQAAHKIY